LVGKPEVRRPFGKVTRRWQDDIKNYLKETEWDGMDWTLVR
jgi:hypothetical protein